MPLIPTLRDQIAMAALPAILANLGHGRTLVSGDLDLDGLRHSRVMATMEAWALADTMLAERPNKLAKRTK